MVRPSREPHTDGASPAEHGARERLLAAATHLFTRSGYAATSVREIVAEAGVTKPVLYYYFENKEGIYRALVEQLLTDFERRLDAGREPCGDARCRIQALCTNLFEFVLENLETVRLFYAVYFGPAGGAPHFDLDVFPRRFRQALKGALAEGVAAGEFRDLSLEDMTLAIEAMLNMAVELALSEPERRFATSDLERLLEIGFTGLAPKSTVAARRAR